MDLSLNRGVFEKRLPILSKKIFLLTMKFGFAEELGKDLTQEILFKAFLKLGSFQGKSKLDSWVYSIGINYCINYRRKKRLPCVDYEGMSEELSYNRTPEQELLDKERYNKLLGLIKKLPEKLKNVLIMQSFEYLKDEDISTILKIPKGTVWSRMHKARTLLKRSFERYV